MQTSKLEREPRDESEQLERKRKAAFIKWLRENGNRIGPNEIDDCDDNHCFSYGRSEYRVLTDDEADEAYAEYVKDSVWAFQADFLAGVTGIDRAAFKPLAELCESANGIISAAIAGSCGWEKFIREAERADGRGHALSSYDGEEREYGDFYIYQTN